MLDSKGFIKLAKQYVYDMAKETLCPTDNVEFTRDNVYVVTFAFVLNGMKAMLSTTLTDGKYYEVTFNNHTDEIYVDQYVKINQRIYQYIDLNNKNKKVVMASEYGESCKSPYQEFVNSINEEPITPMREIEEGFDFDMNPSEHGESNKAPYQDVLDSIDDKGVLHVDQLMKLKEGSFIDKDK